MSSPIDLFELSSAEDLFRETQAAMVEYSDEPSSRLLLFLLFSLNHSREWIAGCSYEEVERKRRTGVELSPAEKFYLDLWALEEFRVINALCNRSKHHSVSRGGATSVTVGATCDDPCTDSLDQIYYRIDGVDSRDFFFPVMRKYWEWFDAQPTQECAVAVAAGESDVGRLTKQNLAYDEDVIVVDQASPMYDRIGTIYRIDLDANPVRVAVSFDGDIHRFKLDSLRFA